MYDIKYETNWTPEYSVCGDLMIFHNIDTPEKRLVMIKAYESFDELEEGGEK